MEKPWDLHKNNKRPVYLDMEDHPEHLRCGSDACGALGSKSMES